MRVLRSGAIDGGGSVFSGLRGTQFQSYLGLEVRAALRCGVSSMTNSSFIIW